MKKEIKWIAVTVCLVIVLNLVNLLYLFNLKYHSMEGYERMHCMVIQKEKESADQISYLVSYCSNKFLLNIYAEDNKLEDMTKLGLFQYGDMISLRGKITIPTQLKNPYEFDYKMYLNSNGMVGTIATNGVEKIGNKVGNPILKVGYLIRDNLSRVIDEKLPTKEANLYKSMLYGDDTNLDVDIAENFRENGIAHMLAVSGMHVMYLIRIINGIVKEGNKKIICAINIIVVTMFCVVSGMQMSVIRASIMAILTLVLENKKYHMSRLQKMGITLLVLLAINPLFFFHVGGMLSFLATLGIILFFDTINSFFVVVLKVPPVLKGVCSLLSLTLSSLVMIVPIQFYYFSSFELMTFVANILLAPIMTLVFSIGFVTLFFAFVPYLSDMVIASNFILLRLVIIMTDWLAAINYVTLYVPKPSIFEVYGYYLVLFLQVNKKRIPVYVSKHKKKLVKNMVTVGTIFIILYSIVITIYRIYFEEYVYFFNVEQGNMALIRQDRKIIVIDMGSTKKGVASNVLSSFLKAKAIYHIDTFVITHMHEDHMNGLERIAEEFKIDRVLYGVPKGEETDEYTQVMQVIEKKNISGIEVQKGDIYEVGDVTIEVLSPPIDLEIEDTDRVNANSNIYLVSANNKYYLLMGDATAKTEEALLRQMDDTLREKLQRLHVLQVGHHGSKTSTTDAFLQQIRPCIAIISSKKKQYGHPSQEVLDKLKKYGFLVKITEKIGAIRF